MIRRLSLAALIPLLLPAPLAAAEEQVAISKGPDRTELTIYRDPQARGAISLRALRGFAMVTETRKIRLPKGRVGLRFEGVAEGIVPVSAVVEGLPGGTIEKNRDAQLLSPASLIDGSLGRHVTLTRTDRATGRQTSEEATIIAGSQPGVVLRTATGVESLRCSGLPEGLQFGGVPAGLASKPVLSVVADSPSARTVTVQLSYLASDFDWRASYVATQSADGQRLDLFAWLTLANGNAQSFDDTQVNAVAGRLNRVFTPSFRSAVGDLRLQCYPLGTTTSNLPREERHDIVVTGSRSFAQRASLPPMIAMPLSAPPMIAPPPPPEDLGDLKLYRVPELVTVNPRGQKQVALLVRAAVPFERRYRRAVHMGQQLAAAPTSIVLVLRNQSESGLGLALPAGSTALYGVRRDGQQQLLGRGSLRDLAQGEMVRISAGTSTQVTVTQTRVAPERGLLRVTNGNRHPVQVEVAIGDAGQAIEAEAGTLGLIDGIATWLPIIEPGGVAELQYRY